MLAGLLVWVALSGAAGMATMFLTGCAGAALLILGQRRVWRGSGV
jgi:hypothetical protein